MLVLLRHSINNIHCSTLAYAPITAAAALQSAARFGADSTGLVAKLAADSEIIAIIFGTCRYPANGAGRGLRGWGVDEIDDIKLRVDRIIAGILKNYQQVVGQSLRLEA